MKIFVCDHCRKEILKWLEIRVSPSAKYEYLNVNDLVQHCETYHICEECFVKISKEIRKTAREGERE